MGVLDDLYGLRARHKLLAQLIVALAVCASGLVVRSVQLPIGDVIHLGLLAVPFTMLWIIGVMNAMNLIDGLDGLAGGVSEIALAAILVLAVVLSLPALGMYAAALAGAVLGFLFYNFNPASIFMGDAGSLFLGYFLSVALLVATNQPTTSSLPLAVPLLVLGVPIADTVLAICRRAIRGQGLFNPDREHLHHRLINRGLSHRGAVLALYGASLLLAGSGLALEFGGRRAAVLVGAGLLLGLLWVLHSFGLFKLNMRHLRLDRQQNRELRSAVSSIASQLKEAKALSQVADSLAALQPAVSAHAVTARFNGPAAEHMITLPPGSSVEMSFPLSHGRRKLGVVHVVWADGRPRVEPEHALAIEELCSHVIRAVRRLTPASGEVSMVAAPRKQRSAGS
ncbi:MAG TPA: MraY family glycosyltransferase [Myxococcales bacterium]|nr:MraY family glycosyltransferase [Myxococcales bacterium]